MEDLKSDRKILLKTINQMLCMKIILLSFLPIKIRLITLELKVEQKEREI